MPGRKLRVGPDIDGRLVCSQGCPSYVDVVAPAQRAENLPLDELLTGLGPGVSADLIDASTIRIHATPRLPPGRRRVGRFESIPVDEIPRHWHQAVDTLRRDGRRLTMKAIAIELGISERTAYDYRRRFGLVVGDEPPRGR
jgi:hypothetical protein